MADKPVIIESAEFHIEQAYLMQDPAILDMVGGLLHDENAPKGQDLLDWLDSHEGMMTAYNVAQQRMIKFSSIGGPARAISAVIVKQWDAR